MLKDFLQLVPEKVCLSCDGCCRFSDCASFWRPKIAKEEIDEGSPSAEIILNNIDNDHALHAVDQDGQPRCFFLETDGHTCRVYHDRPFDCRLYPFLLIRDGGDPGVGVHLSCPYVQEKRQTENFKNHVGLLKEYFQQKEICEFINRNPALIGEYPGYEQEIECLFTVTGPQS